MKTLKIFTIAVVCFFTTLTFANAQANFDDKAVAEVYNQAMKALQTQDAQALVALFTENADHINPIGDIVRGKEALLANYIGLFKMFAQMPKPARVESQVLNQKNRYLTPNILLSTYTQKDTSYFGKESRTEEMACSVLLVKKSGKWLIESLVLTPKGQMPSTPGN